MDIISTDMSLIPEKRKEYMRNYYKKRKEACKSKGVCPNCEKRPAALNRTCCQECLNDKKLCIKFGASGPYRQLYAELFEKQGGRCEICKEYMTRPVLDHCHKTMDVRGLLCGKCNMGLGQFNDDSEILSSALNYIRNNGGIGIKVKRHG